MITRSFPLKMANYSGLIDNNYLHTLWKHVQFHPDREHATGTFWAYYLQKKVFPEEYFFYDTQVPSDPENHPDRKIDGVIRYFERGTYQLAILCVGEWKKAGASDLDMRRCEKQALEACETLCSSQGISFTYAMTVYGTNICLWKYTAGTGFLQPLWNFNKTGKNRYIAMESQQTSFITSGFDTIKTNPPTLSAGPSHNQAGQSYPTLATSRTVPAAPPVIGQHYHQTSQLRSLQLPSSSVASSSSAVGTWRFDQSLYRFYPSGQQLPTISQSLPPRNVWISNGGRWSIWDGQNWMHR